MDSHPKLWRRFTPKLAHDLLLSLEPTPQRVWKMICEPTFKNGQEEKTFDFLRCFILQLDMELLGNFLQFVTGNSQCVLQMIQVEFNAEQSSFKRRPSANTCTMILHLPSTYTLFSTFKQDFFNILSSRQLWAFDSV